VKSILRRSVLLFLFGVFYYGGVSDPWPGIQLGGVLQRVALCYLFAALIYVGCPAASEDDGRPGKERRMTSTSSHVSSNLSARHAQGGVLAGISSSVFI
jgi:hypothetical protein